MYIRRLSFSNGPKKKASWDNRKAYNNFPVSFVAVKWLLWSGEWETVVWAEGWDMIDLSDFGQQLVHSEPEAPFFARQVIIEQSEQRSAPCVYESEKKKGN